MTDNLEATGRAAQTLERAARWVVVAMVFLVPIVIDLRTVDVFNLSKLTVIFILSSIGFALWTLSMILRPRRVAVFRVRSVQLALVLVGATTIATLSSPNRVLSFIGFYRRYEGLLSLCIYVAVFVLVVVVFRGRRASLGDVATGIAAASGVVAFVVLLQALGVETFRWRSAIVYRSPLPLGTIGNSGFTSSALGIGAPFVLYALLAARSRYLRLMWSLLGVLLVVAIWLTQGLAGMLGGAAGLAALFLFVGRWPAWRKSAAVVAALIVLGIAPIVGSEIGEQTQRRLVGSSTVAYRAEMAKASWSMFLDRPLFGWGPESFLGEYPRYRSVEEARGAGLSITDKPHSIYLTWATSAGIVGLVLYLALVGSVLFAVSRAVSKFDDPSRLIIAGFGGGLVAYLVQGLYSIDVPALAFMGWVCLAGLAVLTSDPPPDQPRRSARWLGSSWLRPVALAAVVVLLVGSAFVFGVRPLRADHAAWRAERLGASEWSQEATDLYEKAIALNSRESGYRVLAAVYYARTLRSSPYSPETALLNSVDLYQQAVRMHPRNVLYMVGTGSVFALLGQGVDVEYFEDANSWFRRAIARDPSDPDLRDRYASVLRTWADELEGRKRIAMIVRADAQAQFAQRLR